MAKSSKAPKKVIKTTSAKPKQATNTAKAQKKRPMPSTEKPVRKEELPFTRTNYVLLVAGIAIILLGFILMSIGDFVDATQFSVALHIAPVIVVGGFVEIIFAIMYRPAAAKTASSEEVSQAAA